MTRKRAHVSFWAQGKGGIARCEACGREFTHPSQYLLMGDDVYCRGEKACAARQAQRPVTPTPEPTPEPMPEPNHHDMEVARQEYMRLDHERAEAAKRAYELRKVWAAQGMPSDTPEFNAYIEARNVHLALEGQTAHARNFYLATLD